MYMVHNLQQALNMACVPAMLCKKNLSTVLAVFAAVL